MKAVKKLMIVLITIYVGFCAAVYFYPQFFFYGPTNAPADLEKAHRDGYPAEEVSYTSADGTKLYGWYTKPAAGQHKIVVFMHGNSYNIEKFYPKLLPFVKAGYGTFMGEYRGFGGIKGRITQQGLEEDAIAAVNYLHSLGYQNGDIIVYGASLGSHMAINSIFHLQKDNSFAALVLETPFDSLLNVTKEIVPVPLPFSLIVREKYDNMAMIKEVKAPVLIMGGSHDKLVPVILARNLYEQAPVPKEIIVYDGAGHNNLGDFANYDDILNWLAEE